MDARDIAGHAHGRFRIWFAKVWRIRGGGLYACGYAVTFLILEIRSIAGEIVGSDGLVDFLTNQLLEFFFRFLGESLVNMLYAFAWPAYVVQFRPPLGAIALGVAFFLFPVTLKAPIERWLLADKDTIESP